MAQRLLSLVVATTALAACTPPQSPTDAAAALARMDAGAPPEPDLARVFASSPSDSDGPIEVVLQGVDNSGDGTLASAPDAQGIQRVRVLSCVDEGEVITVLGMGQQRVCTLRARANKLEHGNFVYDDYQAELAGSADSTDLFAEVNLYYHVDRAYRFITAPEVGVFDLLPGRHQLDDRAVPLTVVANYMLPTAAGADSLALAHLAFFIPGEAMRQGMARVQGLVGIEGDVLVFGQGDRADFAYDAETVYHEFGHAVVNATAQLDRVTKDAYGLTSLGASLNEGIADSLAYLISGNTELYAYVQQRLGGSWERVVENEATFPQHLSGVSVWDSDIVLGTLYDLFSALQQGAAYDDSRCARALLLTLQRLRGTTPWSTWAPFADALLDTLRDEGIEADLLDQLRSTLEQRGFYAPYRQVSLDREAPVYLELSGAERAPWNTWYEVEEEGAQTAIAPAFVQLTFTATATTATLRGVAMPYSGPMSGSSFALAPRLYLRAGEPVTVTEDAAGRAAVAADQHVDVDVVARSEGAAMTWALSGLSVGQTYFTLLANLEDSDGLVAQLHID